MFQSPLQCLYHRRSVDGYTRKYVYLNCRVKLAAARQPARGPWKWPSMSRSDCRTLGRGRSLAPSARRTGCLRGGEQARVQYARRSEQPPGSGQMFASRHTSKIDRPLSACLKIRIFSSVLQFLPFQSSGCFQPRLSLPQLEKAQSRAALRPVYLLQSILRL